MKLIDTFYVRHQIPHGWTPEQAATIAAEDLHLAATRMGLKLRSEVKTRLITDGATPTVEAWAYIHPRVTTPQAPEFASTEAYHRWRAQQLAAA